MIVLVWAFEVMLWYAPTAVSPLFTRVRERYVQAELNAELGRLDEARRWFATIDQLSVFGIPYRVPGRGHSEGAEATSTT